MKDDLEKFVDAAFGGAFSREAGWAIVTACQNLSDKWIAMGGEAEEYGRELRITCLPKHNPEVLNYHYFKEHND